MKKQFISLFLLIGAYGFLHGQQRVEVRSILVDTSFDSVSYGKLQQAVCILDSIVNTFGFAKEVKANTFEVGNEGLSSEEIYHIIITGKNYFKDTVSDGSIDLRLKVFDAYYGSLNFGVTDMDTRITRTHRCFILQNDVKCYVSHLAHEYMHQIGFYDWHSTWTGPKTHSVPYRIGNIVDKMLGSKKPCLAKSGECHR